MRVLSEPAESKEEKVAEPLIEQATDVSGEPAAEEIVETKEEQSLNPLPSLQAQQQFVNMGMMQPGQLGPGTFNPLQPQMPNMSPQAGFQFPTPQLQHQMQAPTQPLPHRRNQSALPNMGMGPPPAPSSGALGSSFGNFDNNQNPGRENSGGRGGRGGGMPAPSLEAAAKETPGVAELQATKEVTTEPVAQTTPKVVSRPSLHQHHRTQPHVTVAISPDSGGSCRCITVKDPVKSRVRGGQTSAYRG